MQTRLVLCCLSSLLLGRLAFGQDTSARDSLSVDDVIAMARARAPQVLEAETRVAEARGRVAGAGTWSNPEIEVVTGTPEGADRRTQAELSVPAGLGLKRSRRVRAARADLQSEEQLVRDVRRHAVAAALEALFRTMHAELRRDLAQRRVELAEELGRVARERVSSGDAAQLEMHVADVELSRARSEILTEGQEVAVARADLALVLGLPSLSTVPIAGNLADRSVADGLPDSVGLADRPDILAAESRVRAATAEHSLAGFSALPEVSFRLNYEQEGDANLWMPGVALTVPLFDRGQGGRAQTRARLDRARLELAQRRSGALAGYEVARSRYAATVAAVQELEANGIPGSARVESMIEESYRAGKTDLGSLLVLRRDALETQREYIDRLLDAALRGLDLALATGEWPTETGK